MAATDAAAEADAGAEIAEQAAAVAMPEETAVVMPEETAVVMPEETAVAGARSDARTEADATVTAGARA
jgi:hypothetical protein